MIPEPNTADSTIVELMSEIDTYLEVVDAFRAVGAGPTWADDESLRWGWSEEWHVAAA